MKGPTVEIGFTLSAPKVLYDSRSAYPVINGNSSAMLRFYFLNGESGRRYPVSFGLGTFGVDSPIDVSRSGGGFAASVYLDIVQMLRTLDVNLSYGVNAGFDVSTFSPSAISLDCYSTRAWGFRHGHSCCFGHNFKEDICTVTH